VKRDAYYKHFKRAVGYEKRDSKVIQLVQTVRARHPMMGGKKLHNEIKPELEVAGICLGRDRLFAVLQRHGMLVKTKRRFQKTTHSRHHYAVAHNRIKGLAITKPNQVFVSDLTYLSLGRGFCYLFLVTDLFSRKIVGHYLSPDMSHRGALAALEMATQGIKDTQGIIHHSDRGCQYCCFDFMDALSSKKMLPSMTEESHCYQNAVAERVNGILKLEYYLDSNFASFQQAEFAVKDAISTYNGKRPHWSLNLKTPDFVYSMAA
jgi:putative transposase